MKIRVNPHNVEIVREQTEPINEKEVNVSKCTFEFSDEITREFTKWAYFTLNGETYKQLIENNECDYPSEVLTQSGTLEVGVTAQKIENGQEIFYNPTSDYYDTWTGSLKNAENGSQPTPSELEQLEQAITNNANRIEDVEEKLDTIETGAEVNIIEDVKVNGASLEVVDKSVNVIVPTKTSDITNDSGFIDKNVDDLIKYTLTTETGSKIDLSIDIYSYVMTATLKDKDNNTISSSNIDLPLETMVVNARYDSDTKEIVLVLKNEQEVRFSVADLVSGLQTEITDDNKLLSDLVDDTNQTHKFTSTNEKNTWNAKYDKPSNGIPKSDLVASVQESLNKADSAIQDVSDKEDKSNKTTTISSSSTDIEYPSAKCVYDSQVAQDTEIDRLKMIYNILPTTSDEDIEIELNDTGEMTFKHIDLKGNTSQEVISGETGTNVNATSISISDVNTSKEHTIGIDGNTYQKSSVLPSGYTQVDYIQSTGNQYIDTGVNADKNLRVEMNTSFISPTSSNQTFGAIKTGSPNIRYHVLCGNQKIALWVNDSTYVVGDLDSDKHYYDINPSESYVKFDDTTITIPSNIGDTTLNFWLFGRNSTGSIYMCAMKLWTCKMYYNNVLVRDFIPCYRNSDNVLGLYDIVNNVFYPNNSSSTIAFTYGSTISIPNPDFPQNVDVVTGENNIKIKTKNLLDPSTIEIGTKNGITTTYNSTTQEITFNGTCNTDNTQIVVSTNIISFINGTTKVIGYYVSGSLTNSGVFRTFSSNWSNYDGVNIYQLNSSNPTIVKTTTFNADKILFSFRFDNGAVATNFTIKLMITDSNDTTFAPYGLQTYPINLGNIELCKKETYQDRIYKQNDKWYLYKAIGKTTLTGNEPVTRKATSATGYYSFSIDIGTNIYATDTTQEDAPFYCNKFVSGSRSKAWYLQNCIYPTNAIFSYNSFGFYYDATKEMTSQQFQTWLSQNNVIVYYPYATPTTTEITDSTLVSQLNALANSTLYSTTNINTETSNLLPYIDLQYNVVTPAPSPSRPSVVNVVKGENTLTISNSDDTQSQTYQVNLPSGLELCKISTYQDYFYKDNGNWYKHSEVSKLIYNGSETENWSLNEVSSSYETTRFRMPKTDGVEFNAYFNNFMNRTSTSGSGDYEYGYITSNYIYISINRNRLNGNTATDFKTWLSQNNVIMYYALNTPTNTQITDTTLITQLDNLQKAISYDSQTNISQTNEDKPFIIYAEAIRSLRDVFE